MGSAQYEADTPVAPEATASPEAASPVAAPTKVATNRITLSTSGLRAFLGNLRNAEALLKTAADQLDTLLNS